jgi:hypothetical protein
LHTNLFSILKNQTKGVSLNKFYASLYNPLSAYSNTNKELSLLNYKLQGTKGLQYTSSPKDINNKEQGIKFGVGTYNLKSNLQNQNITLRTENLNNN